MTLLDLTPRVAENARLAMLPVAIIGAGPIGLAAAAHLVERGIDFVVFEAGDDVAASVRAWGHTRLFSPWKHLVDPASRRLLEEHGWQLPDPERAPTGAELVEQYIAPLAAVEAIASRIRLGVEVIGVTREGMDRTRTRGRAGTPFAVRVRAASGLVEDIAARAVIDASGTYRSPNPLSSSGLELLGMAEIADLVTPALPDVLGRDRALFAGRRVTVVGAGHSAANTLLGLVELATAGAWHEGHLADSQRASGAGVIVSRRRAGRSRTPRHPGRPGRRRRPDHAWSTGSRSSVLNAPPKGSSWSVTATARSSPRAQMSS